MLSAERAEAQQARRLDLVQTLVAHVSDCLTDQLVNQRKAGYSPETSVRVTAMTFIVLTPSLVVTRWPQHVNFAVRMFSFFLSSHRTLGISRMNPVVESLQGAQRAGGTSPGRSRPCPEAQGAKGGGEGCGKRWVVRQFKARPARF